MTKLHPFRSLIYKQFHVIYYSVYEAIASEALGNRRSIRSEENVLVIQPYIKWGPNKASVSPEIKLQEAEDLIQSLDTWNINESIKVPLVNYRKNTLFGRGKVDEIRRKVKQYNENNLEKVRKTKCSI